jgi:hypothetical protein
MTSEIEYDKSGNLLPLPHLHPLTIYDDIDPARYFHLTHNNQIRNPIRLFDVNDEFNFNDDFNFLSFVLNDQDVFNELCNLSDFDESSSLEPTSIKPTSIELKSDNERFKNKYLKYKTKYLLLKNKL